MEKKAGSISVTILNFWSHLTQSIYLFQLQMSKNGWICSLDEGNRPLNVVIDNNNTTTIKLKNILWILSQKSKLLSPSDEGTCEPPWMKELPLKKPLLEHSQFMINMNNHHHQKLCTIKVKMQNSFILCYLCSRHHKGLYQQNIKHTVDV